MKYQEVLQQLVLWYDKFTYYYDPSWVGIVGILAIWYFYRGWIPIEAERERRRKLELAEDVRTILNTRPTGALAPAVKSESEINQGLREAGLGLTHRRRKALLRRLTKDGYIDVVRNGDGSPEKHFIVRRLPPFPKKAH